VVACWITGTYLYLRFTTFPRLNIHGERGSGKTKLLQLISMMAFNGRLIVEPTGPVLFRTIEALRSSLCLDEMENLHGDDQRAVRSIINAGYKSGATVTRIEGEAKREPKSYEVYAPIALAGIAGLNAVMADRSITITMERGTDREKIDREV